ncbi:hypothetical protein RB195_003852 [Necator americanus]|uniref:Uncharacterized protein n=1 Tax=Necator americanus TaxID=51031 RepID=A0ABR1DQI2_NECAM
MVYFSSERLRSERRRDDGGELSGISGMGSVSGGCDTMMIDSKAPSKVSKGGVEAAVSNRSKVNALITVLAVIFTQFLFCVAAAVVILLHHNRIVDWFPALLEVTGKGYARSLPDDF